MRFSGGRVLLTNSSSSAPTTSLGTGLQATRRCACIHAVSSPSETGSLAPSTAAKLLRKVYERVFPRKWFPAIRPHSVLVDGAASDR